MVTRSESEKRIFIKFKSAQVCLLICVSAVKSMTSSNDCTLCCDYYTFSVTPLHDETLRIQFMRLSETYLNINIK